MSVIQFVTPDLPDNDGYYHIKLASIMWTEGVKPEFTWLPLTILNEKEFYDHHFLYHVALIPFTWFGDLRLAAKWSAVVFSSLAFFLFWLLFHRQNIPYARIWAVTLLGISDAFLYRMSITRAQSLSLAMLALVFLCLLINKYELIGVLSFFYVWLYDAFPLVIVVTILFSISILVVEHRIEIRPFVYASIGVALGLVINPYFPQNIAFSFRHMIPKLTTATSIRVGNEWFPYDTKQILEKSFPTLVALTAGIFGLGLTGKKMDLRTTFALLVSLSFGLMFLQARRFVEYFPPFVLVFTVFALSPLLSSRNPASAYSAFSIPGWIAANLPWLLLSMMILAGVVRSIPRAMGAVNGSKPYDLYADASIWLSSNSEEGSRVFQTDWDDFPRLFYYNSHNTYLIGLDPTYMQLYDPNLYALWVLITNGDVRDPSQLIANRFGSDYVHTDLKHRKFIDVAGKDPGLLEIYRDDQAVLYQVISP